MTLTLLIVTFIVLCASPLLLLRNKELDTALEDARRRKTGPTDYGTQWNVRRKEQKGGSDCTHTYSSPSWDLIEMRRMQEHQEMMRELRNQTYNQQMMLRGNNGGPVPGGPTDRLWKGEW